MKYFTVKKNRHFYNSTPGIRAHCYAELAVSSQQWPKPSPVLAAPTHGGTTRLSGPCLSGLYTVDIGW